MYQQLSLYLVGPARELPRVRSHASKLDLSGRVRLTSRWFDADPERTPRDGRLDCEERGASSEAAFAAMRRSDVVWILWPEVRVSDLTAAQAGYAIANRWHVGLGRQCVVISGHRPRSSISAAADLHFSQDADALVRILELAARRVLPRSADLSRFSPIAV